MAEVNIRMLRDKDGVPFYPVTNIEAVDGLDPDNSDSLQAQVASLQARTAYLEDTVVYLQTQINNIIANM